MSIFVRRVIEPIAATLNRDARLIALSLFLWGFGGGLFAYIQPLYMERLGAGPIQIGGLFSAASLVTTLGYVPVGAVADRLPRKWVMLVGWVIALVAVLWIGLARTWRELVPGFLLYYFTAAFWPVVTAYLADAVQGRDVGRTLATVFAAYAAGGLFAPAAGGWLAEVGAMRTVYFAATAVFVLSTLVLLWLSPQPARSRVERKQRWGQRLLSGRFLRFAAVTWFVFAAMRLMFPLAPNFLVDVWDYDMARVGALGSFEALGLTLSNLLLGRLDDGRRARGLVIGQTLVWTSALLLLLTGAFPALALAFLLRGAYQGCRTLARAHAIAVGSEVEHGLLQGATETAISVAQIVTAYVAGWLYICAPTWPVVASLALIPLGLLLTVVESRIDWRR